VRLAPVELFDSHLGDLAVSVGVRALHDARELRPLLLVPGHQQGAGVLDGYPHTRGVVGQQLEPARHQPRLQRARLGVEPRVKQRGVRLARACPHVGSGLEQDHTQVEPRELARDRAPHHPAADDRDVRVERLLHGRQYRARTGAGPDGAPNDSTKGCLNLGWGTLVALYATNVPHPARVAFNSSR
jgi:hypothetical protein